jgi:hypothetical protein
MHGKSLTVREAPEERRGQEARRDVEVALTLRPFEIALLERP